MSLFSDDFGVDLHRILAKSLYFALVVNVLLPAVGLYLCHYLATNHFPPNRIGDSANPLFYVFAVLTVAQGGLAWWYRRKLLDRPMIKSMDTIQEDLRMGLLRASRPISLLVAAISLYGYIYFALTGRFRATLILVVFSFVAYQVVRPRLGSLGKLVKRQKQMAELGEPKQD
ncbi:MAG: hypothetical protein OEV49_05615 [candidate division Zixibacteria bacterium]|nr:hypothetical protein [candidate division Zixibacteria bacterium]MDH3936239.1 hypothetical protein [candidate division Zixibacteria bacterium]MDH4033193.1 hypothetical protein [candidate division Zixibacteria bacterium]